MAPELAMLTAFAFVPAVIVLLIERSIAFYREGF